MSNGQLICEYISKHVDKIADTYSISDKKRLFNVLNRCLCMKIKQGAEKPVPFSEEAAFFKPRFEEALLFMPAEKAFDLFENSDLEELDIKEITAKALFLGITAPFYTYQEFVRIIENVIEYLKSNKKSLLYMGYPDYVFEDSIWLYYGFSRLYPTKVPYRALKDEAKRFLYHWAKEKMSFDISPTQCDYEEAALLDGLSDSDVVHIEEQRAKLFNIKVEIAQIAQKYLRQKLDADSLLPECFDIIANKLYSSDFNTFLKIERCYQNIFMVNPSSDGSYMVSVNPLTGMHKHLFPGGIINIWDFIKVVDSELTVGLMHYTRSDLLPLIECDEKITSYYQLAQMSTIDKIDKVLLRLTALNQQAKERESIFYDKLETAIKTKLKNPVILDNDQNANEALQSFLSFYSKSQSNKMDITLFSSSENQRSCEGSIKIPIGTQWEDITIKLLNGHDVVITAKSMTNKIKSDYRTLGFANKRNGNPDVQWEFLCLLAKKEGELSWNDRESDEKYQKRKELLSKGLKAAFQLESDPFLPYKEAGGYKTKFQLINF